MFLTIMGNNNVIFIPVILGFVEKQFNEKSRHSTYNFRNVTMKLNVENLKLRKDLSVNISRLFQKSKEERIITK